MARRRRKARKGTKMRQGECRTTKSGMEYCKFAEGVRFTASVGGVSGGGISGGGRAKRKRKRSGTKGKTCQRFKRVQMKGKPGTVRRCAKFG